MGHDALVSRNVDYCQKLLTAVGADPRRVSSTGLETVPDPWPPVGLLEPFSPGSAPDLLAVLAASAGASDRALEAHPAAPVAQVAIDPTACTGCTICAQTCPTNALQSVELDGRLEISFDAADCTACGQCVPRCPEIKHQAIALSRRTDLDALHAGREVLYQEEVLLCVRCGSAIAPAPMMKRIEALLGPEQGGVISGSESRCMDCRGAR